MMTYPSKMLQCHRMLSATMWPQGRRRWPRGEPRNKVRI